MDESYKFHHFGLFKFRKHLFICFHDSLSFSAQKVTVEKQVC